MRLVSTATFPLLSSSPPRIRAVAVFRPSRVHFPKRFRPTVCHFQPFFWLFAAGSPLSVMDPLSIAAAVCQAADRLATLFASVKTYFAAPQEIDTLENEMGNVMIALNTLQSAASRLPS